MRAFAGTLAAGSLEYRLDTEVFYLNATQWQLGQRQHHHAG